MMEQTYTLSVVLEIVKFMYLSIAYKISSNEQNNNGKYKLYRHYVH
jgi:hypothetical protein